MIFRSLFDLRAYLDRMIDMGIGHAQPVLDRRGCDCASGHCIKRAELRSTGLMIIST